MRKQSDERSESPHLGEARHHLQTLIVPPAHVRITMNVLYDVEARTARYQLEVSDPATRELLGMWSRPYHRNCTAQDALYEVHREAVAMSMALEIGDPF